MAVWHFPGCSVATSDYNAPPVPPGHHIALPWLALLATSQVACADVERSLTPSVGPSSGYFSVEVTEPDLDAAAVTSVRIGDHAGLFIRATDENAVQFTVQGSSDPGATDVTLSGAFGEVSLPGALTYRPPLDPKFDRVVALGASLTQGVQNGVPTQHGSRMSPPAQMAQQMGAYFPLPLLIDPFLRQITVADLGPPPACSPPDVAEHVATSVLDVLPKLAFGGARVDPEIVVHNVAVGGAKLATIVHGPSEGDFAGNFVARFVYAPDAVGPVSTSQLDEIEALDPTLIVMMDAYGNDIAAAVLAGDTIDASRITPIDIYRADLTLLLDRLGATGADLFIGNMPQPSLLPLTLEKRARMIAQGGTAMAADAAIAEMDALAIDFNEILADEADTRARVYVVDIAARIDELSVSGISAGGQQLTTKKFGGLLGFDGVHFTDTGYAMLANLFLENINEQLGTQVPMRDLDRVIATDAGSPSAIDAAGLDVAACD